MDKLINLSDPEMLYDEAKHYKAEYMKIQNNYNLLMLASYYHLYLQKGGSEILECSINENENLVHTLVADLPF